MTNLLFVSEMVLNGQTIRKFLKDIMEVTVSAVPNADDVAGADIIIVDCDGDPRAACAQVRELRSQCEFRDVPIMVAVKRSYEQPARETLQCGASEVVLKPFQGERLVRQLTKAMKPVGRRVKIDYDMIMPFISATIEVIETTTGARAKRTDLFLKKNYTVFGDVTGVMGLSGEYEGVVAITFHQDLAFNLVARMVECEESKLAAADVHDGIGEIINMISGKAKTSLSETKYKFDISLSTVVLGHGHQIAHRHEVPVIVIVFETDGRPFAVQVCLGPANGHKKSPKRRLEKKDRESSPVS